MPSEIPIEKMSAELQLLVSYLLYERENETELRLAFATLCQERHSHFHDIAEGVQTEFTQCKNDVCIKALEMLQNSRKARIEVNEFSSQLIAPFNLKIERTPRSCTAYLIEKSQIQKPSVADGVTILEA